MFSLSTVRRGIVSTGRDSPFHQAVFFIKDAPLSPVVYTYGPVPIGTALPALDLEGIGISSRAGKRLLAWLSVISTAPFWTRIEDTEDSRAP